MMEQPSLPLKLKVCGMKYPDNLQAVAALKPDYLGFIFYPKSKRYMGDMLSPEAVKALPKEIKRMGVFVNAPTDYMLKQAAEYELNVLQLHGDESPEQCKALEGEGYIIVKAFGVGESFDFAQLKPYEEVVDYYLFDTKGQAYGGNGISFDWQVLQQYNGGKPFFLSGGIGLQEVENLRNLKDLPVYALDVNSRFESEPGLKEVALLQQLQGRLKQPGK